MFQPRVFIIIINYNNWPDTLECLKSLEEINYSNYQIVVVDNNSEKKQQIDNPSIIVIHNKENLGFSKGNNIGINFALSKKADYILLLNNDTIVEKSFLKHLIAAAESDVQIALVGPKIYFFDQPKKIWYAGGIVNWLYNKGTMRGYNEEDKVQYDQPAIQDTDYITGCCLLIKSQIIEKIGLMPEEYFLYYEDTDWSLSAQRLGYRCVFVPKSLIWHKGSKSTKEGSESYIYYHIRNGLILAKKYAPGYRKVVVHLDVIWRIKKQIFKLIFMPEKRIWAKNILLGIKDFYQGKEGKL